MTGRDRDFVRRCSGCTGTTSSSTITCGFPGGRRVLANAILELEDGRIVRELDILSGDPRKE